MLLHELFVVQDTPHGVSGIQDFRHANLTEAVDKYSVAGDRRGPLLMEQMAINPGRVLKESSYESSASRRAIKRFEYPDGNADTG